MPINDKNDISLGSGNLEFGTYTNDVFDTYSDVGAIKGTVTITIEREVAEFETGRPLVVIVQEVIRERVMLRATLAEVTLANIKKSLGAGTVYSSSLPVFLDGSSSALRGTLQTGKVAVNSGTLLKFGGTPTHAYIGIRFTHKRADGKRTVFEGYKASPAGNIALPFNESDWNLTDVEFRLLADTNKTEGEQYFQISREA